MTVSSTNIFRRNDTFFGVCEAIGEDFGFNPNWLRVALAVSLLLSPVVVLSIYAAAAVVVLFSRLVAPNPRQKKGKAEAETVRHEDNDNEAWIRLAAA